MKSDTRLDAWKKLARYLQCIRYFNHLSDQFWAGISTNPTYWSIQKISVSLTIQANWLKASGIDLRDIQTQYYDTASKIALGSGVVHHVIEKLDPLWPAGFKPVNLHYEGNPFRDTTLYSIDDSTLCVKMAKPKGLRVPSSFFHQIDSEHNTTVEDAEEEASVEVVDSTPSLSMEQMLNDYLGTK